jgi:hypothetical protein
VTLGRVPAKALADGHITLKRADIAVTLLWRVKAALRMRKRGLLVASGKPTRWVSWRRSRRCGDSIPADRLFKPDYQDDVVVIVDFKSAVIWFSSSEHLWRHQFTRG